MNRKRSRVNRYTASVTGTIPTTLVPSESGIAPAILQLAIYNNNGDLRELRFDIEQEEWFTLAIGGSGTIVWDLFEQEELPTGSGFYARINDSLGTAADISIMARYVRYDERTPSNLNGATYIPSVTRTPNYFGNQ